MNSLSLSFSLRVLVLAPPDVDGRGFHGFTLPSALLQRSLIRSNDSFIWRTGFREGFHFGEQNKS